MVDAAFVEAAAAFIRTYFIEVSIEVFKHSINFDFGL